MRLFLFGVEINPLNELEIENVEGDEFGFNITIKYIDSIYNGAYDTKYNCTEFHHLYNKESTVKKFPEETSSAFESDIHGTGCTRRVNEIEHIKVEQAYEIHKKF